MVAIGRILIENRQHFTQFDFSTLFRLRVVRQAIEHGVEATDEREGEQTIGADHTESSAAKPTTHGKPIECFE